MTQRARRRNRRSRGSARRRIFIALALVFSVIAVAMLGVAAYALNIWDNTPPLSSLKPIKEGSISVVYAADGSRLGYIQSDTIRHPVASKKIPKLLKYATVAIEDKNFYEHGGVDYASILRAAIADVKAGSPVQGGSTITQQLVRNLYISHPQEDLKRKIQEAKLATEYEDKYSKDQILTKYLNTASYGTTDGRTAVGVQAAAETYFNKGVSQLDLPEAAMIAGLPQAPSDYNPLLNPKAAITRRNEVLLAMEQQGYISQADYDQASRAGLGLDRGYKYETIHQPYFFDYVQQQLIDKYGVNQVRNGGLKVYTTINPQMQAEAEQAIADHPYASAAHALVTVNPANGDILTMASSTNYATSNFNLAAQGQRQPGSAFKAFVLTDAIKQGVDPDSTYYNSKTPITLTIPGGGTWTVNNAEAGTGGAMSLAQATTDSVNVVYAQLDLDLGPQTVTQTAKSMGITSPLYSYPAEAIGGLRYGVTPLEMANAYATLADGGIRNTPTSIAKVVFPNGDTDVPDQGTRTRVMPDGVAYEVTKILKTVLESGTAAGEGIGCPAAGKTGTTENNTDAWFVGYTPRLSTAVWTGYPNARISLGPSAFGGSVSAPLWQQFMSSAHGSYCGDFPQPSSMPSLTSFSGAHTVSGSKSGVSPSGTAPAAPVTPGPTAPSTGSGAGGTTGKYPSQTFAPGAGQGPAPAPPANNGGGTGGGTGGSP
jgi:penicillin-binding protein 1A